MAHSFDAQGNYEPVNAVHDVPTENIRNIRPKIYYGDGPFEEASSESGDELEVYGEKDFQKSATNNDAEDEGLLPRHALDLIPKKQV
jgi:hypothetical protein